MITLNGTWQMNCKGEDSWQEGQGQSENGMCTGTKLLFLSCRDGSVPHRSLSGSCRIIQI